MSPKIMTESEIDPIAEEIDEQISESGEMPQIAHHKVDISGNFGDLSDGGMVGRARVIPVGESGRVIFDKRMREPGRPTVRAVWTWDGRPSTIPLSYEPSGKRHDGGRKYLLKRHCVVCNYSGFYGPVCPACRKDGREQAPVIPAYYPRFDKVPKALQFFGNVDCFVPSCIRRGKYGFLDEPQMRQHAMGKHRLEYRAFQDSHQASSDRELAELRQQVMLLMGRPLTATAEVQAKGKRRSTKQCGCGATYVSRTLHQRTLAHRAWEKAQAAGGAAQANGSPSSS